MCSQSERKGTYTMERFKNKIEQEKNQLLNQSEQETIELFRKQVLGSSLGSLLVVGTLATVYLIDGNNTHYQCFWFFIILGFIGFRYIQGIQFYKARPGSEQAEKWSNLIHVYTIGAGLSWGSSPYIFHPESSHELIFTTIYACGLIAAATVSLSARMKDYLLFTSCIALPITFFHLTSDYPHAKTSGILFLLYFMVTSYFARNVSLLQSASNNLSKKNINLIQHLLTEKENAVKANIEKTRFIAYASHDLRQPLHALGLYLDSLDNDDIDESEKKDIVKKSKSSLRSLDDLFTALLDISNIDAGAISISPVHFKIQQLFYELRDQIRVTANLKEIDIHISTDDEHIVCCDPVLSTRCVRNILINALRHSGCSHIHISSISHQNNIEVRIEDNGKGIAEENLELIFEEFQQLDNPNRDRKKGLGLGLTIVKGLLELQGHKLTVTSELGKGTCFSIFLPYGSARHINDVRYNTKQLNKLDFKKSILLIDDEEAVLDSMRLLLNAWEQEIQTAESIETAIEIVSNGFKPDIVISDYRLQNNKTGADAINSIKPQLKDNTQIIFITGETDPNKINEIRSHGYPLIHKPVMPINLRSILTNLNQELK